MVAALGLAVSALSGCSSADDGANAEPPADLASGDLLLGSMPLAYFLQNKISIQAAVDVAIERRTADCMQNLGFDFRQVLTFAPEAPTTVLRRYGVTDVESAEANGYMQPGSSASSDGQDDSNSFPTEPSALQAYTLALFGAPEEARTVTVADSPIDVPARAIDLPGGCLGGATVDFFGGYDEWSTYATTMAALDDINLESFNHLSSSEEYAELLHEWVSCANLKGEYRFNSPEDAINNQWSAPRPSAEEVRVATIDASCKADTQFVQRCIKIESAWQSRQAIEGLAERYAVVSEQVLQRLSG